MERGHRRNSNSLTGMAGQEAQKWGNQKDYESRYQEWPRAERMWAEERQGEG